MKSLPLLSFTAALVAFLVLPLPFELSVAILVSAALVGMLIVDYSRTQRRRLVPAKVGAVRKERFGLAA